MHAPPLIHQCRSIVLLSGILLLLFTTPWVTEHGILSHTLRTSYILIFCIGGYLLNPTRAWLKRYLIAGIPLAAIVFLKQIHVIPNNMAVVINLLVLALQLNIFQAVFTHILFSRESTPASKILGGVCGYLLLAVMFANLYSIILIFDHNAIQIQQTPDMTSSELMYYSLVTITTLGYGDIVSISPHARILSALEAVSGNLYLAILISRLASQYLFRPKPHDH